MAKLIDAVDELPTDKIEEFGQQAKQRIIDEYSWEYIAKKYSKAFSCN